MKVFDLDSPVIRALNKMTDLLLLNFLTAICCIPIVTAGASFTALHYMSLKLARNEECYIARGFFKSFKQNFKQATIIWLLFLLTLVVLIFDFQYIKYVGDSFNKVLHVVIILVAIIVGFTGTFVFPVLAKFDNTVLKTIKNAFIISGLQFPKTILMFVMNWLPWVLMVIFLQIAPLSVLFGFSAPAFASAFLYNKFFKKLEEKIQEENGISTSKEDVENEEDKIFHDTVEQNASTNKITQ